MNFMSKIKKSLEKIKEYFIFLLRIAVDKKTIFLGLCGLMFYRMRHFPIEISTSEFLKLLDRAVIRSLCTLGNRIVLFKDFKNNEFLCNYYVQNTDDFNKTLMYYLI